MAAPKKKPVGRKATKTAKAKKATAAATPDQDESQAPESESGITRLERRSAKDADLIRQDRSIQLVHGMFVMDANPNIRLTERQEIQGIELVYRFSPMSAFALRVLHALAGMLQLSFRGEITSFSIEDVRNARPGAEAAWTQMGKGAPSFGEFLTTIRTSNRQLAEAVGENTSGPALKRVYETLKQLSEVMIHMKNPATDMEVSTPLIQVGRQGGDIVIIVNPRMVKTVAQRTVGAFTVLSARDVRNMRGQAAVLLYTRLCAIVNAGSTCSVGQDKLEMYIWGNALEISPETREARKGRVKALRRALIELEEHGWKIAEVRSSRGESPVYQISRPEFTPAQRRQLKHSNPPAQLTLLPEVSDPGS